MEQQVRILGQEYTIKFDKNFTFDNADGIVDFSTKKIVINDFEKKPNTMENIGLYKDKVCRHEIIHAFLHESGLDIESWARNEEIVDWLALQIPKMVRIFKEVNCL